LRVTDDPASSRGDGSLSFAHQKSSDGTEGEREIRRRSGFTRGAVTASLVAAAALIHPAASLLGRFDWRADLITHFTGPALAVTVIAAAILVRRHPRLALVLGCLAVSQTMPLWRYAGSNPVLPEPRSPARLRLLMANVLEDNLRYEDVEKLIRRERPDIVGLIELTPEWLEGLAAIRAEFPYRAEDPSGATGLALWFRERPVMIDPPERPLSGASPFLHAEFIFAGRPRHLWLVHPDMPFTRKGRPELAALAGVIGRTKGSRIVIGDLNTTEGSPRFSDFLLDTGLRDSRLGFGRQPSWPADFPYRIALEHAFLSDDLAVVARRLGPEIGSDHFPLILELAPAAGADAAAATNSTIQSGAPGGSGRGG
jgi:endonuclease/exonuclease/phosphatase (EEP) superfamily protein YafD